jgi:hypothetical protein
VVTVSDSGASAGSDCVTVGNVGDGRVKAMGVVVDDLMMTYLYYSSNTPISSIAMGGVVARLVACAC